MRVALRNISIALLVAGVAYGGAATVMFTAGRSSADFAQVSFNTPNALVSGSEAATLYGWCFVAAAVFFLVDGVLGITALRREGTAAIPVITVFQAVGWVSMILLMVLVILNLLSTSTLWLLVFLASAALFGASGHVAQRVKREIRAEEGRRYKGRR